MLGLSDLYRGILLNNDGTDGKLIKERKLPLRWMQGKCEVEGGALDARRNRVGSRVVERGR